MPPGFRPSLRTAQHQPGADSDDELDERSWWSPDEPEMDATSGADAACADGEMAPRVRSPTDEERLSPVSKLLLLARRRR